MARLKVHETSLALRLRSGSKCTVFSLARSLYSGIGLYLVTGPSNEVNCHIFTLFLDSYSVGPLNFSHKFTRIIFANPLNWGPTGPGSVMKFCKSFAQTRFCQSFGQIRAVVVVARPTCPVSSVPTTVGRQSTTDNHDQQLQSRGKITINNQEP